MLLDTSGFLCLIDKREPRQERAVELYDRATTRLTHNYVLAELVALGNSRGVPRQAVLEFSDGLLTDGEVELTWVDETLHREALDLLIARPDKTYSLCDAVSFVLMRERGETEALTTDRHFEQEGLVRLLTP
jgi:predicted nucleic acid-binding protein